MRAGIGLLAGVALLFGIIGLVSPRESAPSESTTPAPQTPMKEIRLTSSAFEHNGAMPERFTCDGEDASPPLEISNAPEGTETLALVMHDPDAPRAGGWTHWVKWNISPETRTIPEGTEPPGVSGKGTGGNLSYQGPCPPSGTHRYIFTVYALDASLTLKEGATRAELKSAMNGHILGTGELIGPYSRKPPRQE